MILTEDSDVAIGHPPILLPYPRLFCALHVFALGHHQLPWPQSGPSAYIGQVRIRVDSPFHAAPPQEHDVTLLIDVT
jgi:hypothetical protein